MLIDIMKCQCNYSSSKVEVVVVVLQVLLLSGKPEFKLITGVLLNY